MIEVGQIRKGINRDNRTDGVLTINENSLLEVIKVDDCVVTVKLISGTSSTSSLWEGDVFILHKSAIGELYEHN